MVVDALDEVSQVAGIRKTFLDVLLVIKETCNVV